MSQNIDKEISAMREEINDLEMMCSSRGASAVTDARRRELRAMPYRIYLSSPEWNAGAHRTKEVAGGRCQVCSGRGKLNVHHRTYERRGDERDDGLIVLCAPCHVLFHKEVKLASPSDEATIDLEEAKP